jgi:hypothetical protein
MLVRRRLSDSFYDMTGAKDWFEQAAISDSDRLKIARTNAQKLFRGL